MNCIDISLIFRCILLPLLLTRYILDCLLLKSRQKAHFPLVAANIFCFCITYIPDYAEKTQGWNKQMFCFVALCILYVLNLLFNGSDNIKPSFCSVYIYLFMLCDFLLFFMKSAIQHYLLNIQKIFHSSLIAIV